MQLTEVKKMPANYNTLLRNTYFKEKKSLCDKLGIKVTNFEKSWTILILIFQSDCIFGCQLRSIIKIHCHTAYLIELSHIIILKCNRALSKTWCHIAYMNKFLSIFLFTKIFQFLIFLQFKWLRFVFSVIIWKHNQ